MDPQKILELIETNWAQVETYLENDCLQPLENHIDQFTTQEKEPTGLLKCLQVFVPKVMNNTRVRNERTLFSRVNFFLTKALQCATKTIRLKPEYLGIVVDVFRNESFYDVKRMDNDKEPPEDYEFATPVNSKSKYLFKNINVFGQLGGFDEVIYILKSTNKVSIIKSCQALFKGVQNHLKPKYIKKYSDVYQKLLFERLLALEEDELKLITKQDIEDFVGGVDIFLRLNSLSQDNIAKITEPFNLEFALKCFKSNLLEKKLNGLAYIEEAVSIAKNRDEYDERNNIGYPIFFVPFSITNIAKVPLKMSQWTKKRQLLSWLNKNKIIEDLFDRKSTRDQLIKKGKAIIEFLAQEDELSKDQINLIWETTDDKYLSSATFEILYQIITSLSPANISFIWKKIESTNPEEWTKERITFAFDICRRVQYQAKTKSSIEIQTAAQLMWKLLLDNSKVSDDIAEIALDKYFTIVWDNAWQNFRRLQFYQKFIDCIKKDDSVVQCVIIILKIMDKFELLLKRSPIETPINSSDDVPITKRKLLIRKLDSQHNLLLLLIEELCRYKKKVTTFIQDEIIKNDGVDAMNLVFSGRYKHGISIQKRLDLLFLVLKKIKMNGHTLNPDLVDLLWTHLYESSNHGVAILDIEREMCLEWFRKICIPVLSYKSNLVPQATLQHIFKKWLASCNKQHLTLKGFYCLRTYFCVMNQKYLKMLGDNDNFDFKVVDYPDQYEGLNELWEVVIDVESEDVFKEASIFLIKLYTKLIEQLRPLLRGICERFVTQCVNTIIMEKMTYDQKRLTQKSIRAINHSIQLLKIFLEKTKQEPPLEKNETKWDRREERIPRPVTTEEKNRVSKIQEFLPEISEIVAMIALRKHNMMVNETINTLIDESCKGEYIRQAQKYLIEEKNMPVCEFVSPTIYLANYQEYFEALLSLLDINSINRENVWEIIDSLPPNKALKDAFWEIDKINEPDWEKLLNSKSMFRLLYSLQIIYSLIQPDIPDNTPPEEQDTIIANVKTWSNKFYLRGGFKYLYKLLQSDLIQKLPQQSITCNSLAYLLKIVYHFREECFKGETETQQQQNPTINCDTTSMSLSEDINLPEFLKNLMTIVWHASNPTQEVIDRAGHNYSLQVVEYTMRLLSYVVHANPTSLYHFYNIKISEDIDGKKLFLLLLQECRYKNIRVQLAKDFLDLCQNYKLLSDELPHPADYFLGELLVHYPFGISGGNYEEYFYILTKLITLKLENPNSSSQFKDFINNVIKEVETRPGDLSELIKDRDQVLIGCMNVLCVYYKMVLNEKLSLQATNLLIQVFNFCVYLPDRPQQHLKCLTEETRNAAFQLLRELAVGSLENYLKITTLIQPYCKIPTEAERKNLQHQTRMQRRDEFVGLHNLGSTCYANALIQQFFMIPDLRHAVLMAEDPKLPPNENSDDLDQHLIPEIKRMFSHLQESERQFYNPTEFMIKWSSHTKINITQQQDAEEFYNLLTERIEYEIKASNQKNFIDIFKGQLHREICCSTEAKHRSEGFEDITSLSVEIDKKKNLHETLLGFFEGEKIQDFTCQECNKQVEVTKSFSLKSLPQTMIIVLKRFRFNAYTMQREKICDRFEYPLELNMKEYMSSKADTYEDDDYLYQLVGVVVHSGTVDAGHYYSFIKERSSEQEKWYRFDDRTITDFNPADLAQETFGGDKFPDPRADMFRTRNVYMLFYEKVKHKNLWKDFEKRKILRTSVPSVLRESIRQENTDLLHQRLRYDKNFFTFFRQIVDDLNVTKTLSYQPDDYVLLVIKSATIFLFEVITMDCNEAIFESWTEILIRHYSNHIPACKWFINSLCTNNTVWLNMYLLESSDTWLRENFRKLIEMCISRASEQEQCLYKDYFNYLEAPEKENAVPFENWTKEEIEHWLTNDVKIPYEYALKITIRGDLLSLLKMEKLDLELENNGIPKDIIRQVKMSMKSILAPKSPKDRVLTILQEDNPVNLDNTLVTAKFITYLISIMEETRVHWRKFQQYWGILDFIVYKCGHNERYLLQRYHQLVIRLIDYYMGPHSTRWRSDKERVPIGLKNVQQADLTSFMWVLAHIICACDNDYTEQNKVYPFPPTAYPDCPLIKRHGEDLAMLYNSQLFMSLIKQAYNPQANSLIIAHLCWEDPARSSWIMSAIQDLFKNPTVNLPLYTALAQAVLGVYDSYAMWRTALLLGYKGRGLFSFMISNEHLKDKYCGTMVFLMETIKTNPIVAGWLKKTDTQFASLINEVFKDIVRTLSIHQVYMKSEDDSLKKQIEEFNLLKGEFLSFIKGTMEGVNISPYPPDFDLSVYGCIEIPKWIQPQN